MTRAVPAIASREIPFWPICAKPLNDADGARGGFALGAMKGVVVSCALVILQIHLNGLGEEDVVHVIRDNESLAIR